ncbi:transmembrane protein 182 isoform X2 [Rhinopithecus roxellana]|uniref:transmembrane protein 182 isoform X2 n=1 Tax=Rhinopithecus roxellana TaxID=61622 RepID=UPI0012372953|nr:transmembrane protein 182 isoform X2 [Rhinopithecus roxellana]
MRLNIAIFFGALFGALGVLLFLVAFGSDYWLLATEVGRCSSEQNIENVTFHHEGFFWRCWFHGIVEENDSSIWKFWYTNQPPSKNCTHAYLSPYPFMRGEHNSTSYDSAVRFLGFEGLEPLSLKTCVVWMLLPIKSYRRHLTHICQNLGVMWNGLRSIQAHLSLVREEMDGIGKNRRNCFVLQTSYKMMLLPQHSYFYKMN